MSNLVQYVLVRSDLKNVLQWPWGAVIAQACHASVAALTEAANREETRGYLSNLSSMRKVVLEVQNEDELRAIAARLAEQKVPHYLWIEMPEGVATALATAVS